MTQIAVRLDPDEVVAIDQLVSQGRYPTRAAAIRAALARQRRDEREQEIEAAYASGYGHLPPEPAGVISSATLAGFYRGEATLGGAGVNLAGLARGTVWYAVMPEPIGRRPVVVLTRNVAVPYLTNVTVALVIRTVRGIPSEVALGPAEGLPEDCVASADNIHTIPNSWLAKRLGALGAAKLDELARAVGLALDV